MTETRSATGLLSDRVEYWANAQPDNVAIKFEDRQWTWAQWRDRIHRVSGALMDAGIKRGDVVAFLDKNTPACLEVTLGASAIGAVNAVLNWRLAARRIWARARAGLAWRKAVTSCNWSRNPKAPPDW